MTRPPVRPWGDDLWPAICWLCRRDAGPWDLWHTLYGGLCAECYAARRREEAHPAVRAAVERNRRRLFIWPANAPD